MGCGYSQTPEYVVQLTSEERKHETPIFRHPQAAKGLVDRTPEGHLTMKDGIIHTDKRIPSTPFLGTRRRLPDGKLGEYQFISFHEAFTRARAFGSGLLNLNLVPEIKEYKDYACRFFGVYSKNSAYWGITDMANSLYGLTSVPIYDTLGEHAIEYVFDVTNLTTLVLSLAHLKGIVEAVKARKTKNLKTLIVMEEELSKEDRELAQEAGLFIYSFKDVVDNGTANPQEFPDVRPEQPYTLCYTSG